MSGGGEGGQCSWVSFQLLAGPTHCGRGRGGGRWMQVVYKAGFTVLGYYQCIAFLGKLPNFMCSLLVLYEGYVPDLN